MRGTLVLIPCFNLLTAAKRLIGRGRRPLDFEYDFFGIVDPRIHGLAVNWHSFDLESIAEQTDWVLLVMKVKRDAVRSEVRARSAASEKPSGQPQSSE